MVFKKCMSCLRLVVRLNSFRGFNLAHTKPTPICPFIFHLYDSQRLLTEEEEIGYKMAKELAGYWITPESDSRLESKDEGQANTPVVSSVPEEPLPLLNRLKRMKKTYRASQGLPPVRSKGKGSQLQPEKQPEAQLEIQLNAPQPVHNGHSNSKEQEKEM